MGRKARQRADEPRIGLKKRDDQAALDAWRLLQLVLAGHTAAVEAMLGRGVDVNATDENGWSPLFHASQKGQPSMVKALLTHRACATLTGKSGETALMVASEQGQLKIAGLLLAANCSVNMASSDGTTALMGACLHSRIDVARLLLEKKADVDASTIQGGTAVAVACHGDEVLSADIVGLLLSSRAEVDALGQFGSTPLISACQNGHTGAVGILLDHKANINHQTTLGQTALTTAVMANRMDIFHLLLSRGAVPFTTKDSATSSNPDPLMVSGARVLVKDLVQAADLNGLIGEILSYDSVKGRHAVRLPCGEEKLIKSANLKPLGNHTIDLSARGRVRKLAKFMNLKLGREVVPDDIVCLIQHLDQSHMQCTMHVPGFSTAMILGQVVDLSRHSDKEGALLEAVDSAAFQMLKALRRQDNMGDDELESPATTSREDFSDPEDIFADFPDPTQVDLKDPEAVAAFADHFNKKVSKIKMTKAKRLEGESASDSDEARLEKFEEAMGLLSEPKMVANGIHQHIFVPSVKNLVAGGKCTPWSPGTSVLTKEGKRGTILLYDATAQVYSVKLKSGKERCYKRSQLRRAPMPAEEAKKFLEAIRNYEEQNRCKTFITKHMKIVRIPKEQIPGEFRKSLHGQDLIWMVQQDTRAWPSGVEFQGEPVFIDPLVERRNEIFGEDWFNLGDAKNPRQEVSFGSLPSEIAQEILGMLNDQQVHQSGCGVDARLRNLLQKHGLISISYVSSVTMPDGSLKDESAAKGYRLSPQEMWGVGGGTLDDFISNYPTIGLSMKDWEGGDASVHFAALDELQSQNARMHDAREAERRKKEEALQVLEETQRMHEAKEKQYRDRELGLLEQLHEAEMDFARHEAALQKEKKSALNKLRGEIERLRPGCF